MWYKKTKALSVLEIQLSCARHSNINSFVIAAWVNTQAILSSQQEQQQFVLIRSRKRNWLNQGLKSKATKQKEWNSYFLTGKICKNPRRQEQDDYLHSSVFDDASLVHLLPNPVDHEDNVGGLRGAVLRRGLLHVTSMEPRATAGD